MNSFLNILALFALLNAPSIRPAPIPDGEDQQKMPQESASSNQINAKPKILQAVMPGGMGGMIPPYNPMGQMYPNQGMMPGYPGQQYPGIGMGYPNMGYPGMGMGGYPAGQYPGMGMGMGYPGTGYPNMGYPGMGTGYPGQYPGMGYPGMGMGYPGMGMGYPGMGNPYQQGPYGYPYNGGGFPAGGGIQSLNPFAPNPLTPMTQKKLKK